MTVSPTALHRPAALLPAQWEHQPAWRPHASVHAPRPLRRSARFLHLHHAHPIGCTHADTRPPDHHKARPARLLAILALLAFVAGAAPSSLLCCLPPPSLPPYICPRSSPLPCLYPSSSPSSAAPLCSVLPPPPAAQPAARAHCNSPTR